MAKRGLDYNWAKDKEFAANVAANLLNIFEQLRTSRREREERWQQSYRAWSVDQTKADRNYSGLADIALPQIRKEVETMSRRLFKALMPDDYLKAEPKELIYEDLTLVNTQLVRHYFDNVIRIKTVFYPWIKQNVLFGSSPIRSYWEKKQNEMMYRKREPKLMPDGTIKFNSRPVQEMVTLYDAPKLRTEDLFNTFVYPHNAQRPEDVEMNFFRTKISKYALQEKARQGLCVGFDEFKDSGSQIEQEFAESQERLQQFGETGQFLALQENGYFTMLEVWCQLVLPDTDVPVSCVVEIVDNQYCTRIQRNPYFHQMMPYDWMRYIIPPPGEFYGRGLPEASISVQHQLDDTMNQTVDANTLRLNNITIINPAYAPNSESFEMEPGATWWADPAAVKQFEFPDLSVSGMNAASMLRGIITEMSDNSPQLPDPIAGKARSTGQAQLAINEWQTDLFTFVDFICEDALSPLAYKVHLLIQQNISDDNVIRITGKYADTFLQRVVTPEEVTGQYRFKWLGAIQIENQAVKTQQMLNFMKIFPTLPPEAQAQIKLNWPNIIMKVFRDSFMVRDLENIIETPRMKASTAPSLEERIIKLGGMIQVVESDDDAIHLRIHEYEQARDKDPLRRAIRERHIIEHKEQIKKKQLAAQVMQQQLQAQQQNQLPGRPGNPGQINESISQDNIERGMGLETM